MAYITGGANPPSASIPLTHPGIGYFGPGGSGITNLPQPRRVDPNALQMQQLLEHLSRAAAGFPPGVNPGGPMLPAPQVTGPISLPNIPNPGGGGYGLGQTMHDLGQDAAGAKIWEAHHPGAMHSGQGIPGWVLAQLQPGDRASADSNAPTAPFPTLGGGIFNNFGGGKTVNPEGLLANVINNHRASNGLAAMHPDEIHKRVASLAHEIVNTRKSNGVVRRLRRVSGNFNPQPSQPTFTAS